MKAPAGAPPELEGWARFSREQHLQLDFELRHRPDAAAPARIIRLQRKLRGGATNYLDHPALGVLARVTPAAEPADETADETADGTADETEPAAP